MRLAAQKCMKEIHLTVKLKYFFKGILQEEQELKLLHAVLFISYSYDSSECQFIENKL